MVAMLLAAVILLVIAAIDLTVATRRTVEQLPRAVDAAIAREASATRASVEQLAADVRSSAVDEIRITRQELLGRVDQLGGQAVAEVRLSRELAGRVSGRALELADFRLAQGLEELAQSRRELVHLATPPLQSVTKVMDGMEDSRVKLAENLSPWTDCHGNGACWQAQTTALLGAARVTAGETSRTMREVRIATPKIAGNVESATANVAKLTQPESLGMRLVKMIAPLAGGALFGAIK